MPEAAAAISLSRMARMLRPYLERTNMNMQVMQRMMASAATHR